MNRRIGFVVRPQYAIAVANGKLIGLRIKSDNVAVAPYALHHFTGQLPGKESNAGRFVSLGGRECRSKFMIMRLEMVFSLKSANESENRYWHAPKPAPFRYHKSCRCVDLRKRAGLP
jgi:hypothetical protein